MRTSARFFTLALSALLLLPATAASAAEPVIPVDLPVLGHELAKGTGKIVITAPIAPAAKTVDGAIADWVGQPSRYAGTAVYSGGEYVYQDHLFDAFGADDGEDVELNATLDPLAAAVPETYRSEAVFRYLAGELGLPPPLEAQTNYGDLGPLFTADLEEVHVAIDSQYVHVLARTTALASAAQTALLVMVDNGGAEFERAVGFNSGLRTRRGDAAALVAGSSGWAAPLGGGPVTALPAGSVATDPTGYTNAIEASIPRSAFGLGPGAGTLRIAIAAGPFDAAKNAFAGTGLPANVANVAFRSAEPVREWFEKQQAFSLYAQTIDPFFAAIDIARLTTAKSERFVPGYGYHERIFMSTELVSSEGSRDPIWQHYGVYLPKGYVEGVKLPLQFWLHWRGGTAHSAGTATPDVFRHLGEAHKTIVVSPRGRGTSSWYVGAGHLDILEVFAEATSTYAVDLNRVYLAGHSMGGWGSYLFSVLYPDRFAAALPASPPQTQGLFTGLDFEGCEDYTFGDYNLCYSPTDDGRARDQALAKMLPNLRHLPVAVFQGMADELVWYPGVLRNSLALTQLGYRNRLYSFPTQEHYGPPAWDQWADAASYMHRFVRDPNPSHVTYIRDMPFERAVEEIRTRAPAPHVFDFDHAYWMSGLTPRDAQRGAASFDGRSFAIPEAAYLTAPDAGGPAGIGQTGPYLMTGLQWISDPTVPAAPAVNSFQATLNGTKSVRLDMVRMRLDVTKSIGATVRSVGGTLVLNLTGPWAPGTYLVKTAAGVRLPATLSGDTLTVYVPQGASTFTIRKV